MKIKAYTVLTLITLLLCCSGQAMGQFVNINLELPAGISFPSRVIEPNLSLNGEGIVWIELVGYEKLEILVNLSAHQNSESYHLPIYFLNDGSSNFAKAKSLTSGIHSFQLDQRGLLIRNIQPKIINLNAWIGLPAKSGITATIEYP